MAIRTDYRITDDKNEIEDVSVARVVETETSTSIVVISQDGNEIAISVEMAKDLSTVIATLAGGGRSK